MEAKKHRIRFHSYNDLEINHLIVPFNSIYLNIAFGVFILGQLMFLLGFPLFAKQLNVNGNVMYFTAHLFSWLGEGFLLYSLMRGMVVLKKSFGKLFWAAIIGLTIVRLSLGILHLTGAFDGDISILLFFVLMIPYYILGFEINHSYYEKLSVTGTLMLLTALLNLTYIIAQTFVGNYLVSDIVCLVCALIYIIFLRRILVGSEHVEDISKLTNRQDADNDESNSRNKQKIERSDRHDREVNYVISPESKQRMNIATALLHTILPAAIGVAGPRPRPRGLAAPRSTALAALGLRSAAKPAPPSATPKYTTIFAFNNLSISILSLLINWIFTSSILSKSLNEMSSINWQFLYICPLKTTFLSQDVNLIVSAFVVKSIR